MHLYYISMMGTLLGECLPSIGPTFSREFPRWPAVRPSVLSRFSKCEGPNEAAWPWQKAGGHDFFASPEVVATIRIFFVFFMTIGSLGGGFNMFQPI